MGEADDDFNCYAKPLWRGPAVRDLYKKYLRFGLVLGRLAILKKIIGRRLRATFESVFFMFSGAKKTLIFLLKML